jgi:shikimate dehydrogenase
MKLLVDSGTTRRYQLITTHTKLVGLLGYPLETSFSPKMQNAAFKATGLDCYYFPIEVGKDEVGAVINGIRYMNFMGLNVTKPNKVRVMRYLDEIDELASKIGAVNTIKIENGKMIGYNTDGEGYVESLKTILGDIKGKRFTLLGAGGAGRAIAFTLAKYGAGKIHIFDRVVECGEKVVSEVNALMHLCTEYVYNSEENLIRCIDDSDVIINATGMGMINSLDSTPVNKDFLRPGLIVSDLTYNPSKTRLLKEAESQGCTIHNGVGMLIHQGAKAFEIWTGLNAPIELMTEMINEAVAAVNERQ